MDIGKIDKAMSIWLINSNYKCTRGQAMSVCLLWRSLVQILHLPNDNVSVSVDTTVSLLQEWKNENVQFIERK
jgi:hypothetical protein